MTQRDRTTIHVLCILFLSNVYNVDGLNTSNNQNTQAARLNSLSTIIGTSTRRLTELEFVGVGEYDYNSLSDSSKNRKIKSLFLAPVGTLSKSYDKKGKFYAMPVPINENSNLLDSIILPAYAKQRLSKVRCLALNAKFVNRDDGLFDNLPWKEWSIGYSNALDAAGNVIEEKYCLGKKDAFDRFNGKDWPGRSFSIGNLAARTLYELNLLDDNDEIMKSSEKFDAKAVQDLALRVLEMELREARSLLAEVEAELAVLSTRNFNQLSNADTRRTAELKAIIEDRRENIEQIEQACESLSLRSSSMRKNVLVKKLLEYVINMTYEGINGADEKKPPYRGAYGYAPYVDSKEDMFNNSIMPYNGPLDLLCELIDNQLRADITGVFLENSWLLDNNIVLGGACVLQRRGTYEEKTVQIEGQNVSFTTECEDKEADLVESGDIFLAECDTEEAVGLALNVRIPIIVENHIWESTKIRASFDEKDNVGFTDPFAPLGVTPIDTQRKKGTVNDSTSSSENKRSTFNNFTSNIKTTSGIFGSNEDDSMIQSNTISVPSLEVLDSMSLQEKAALLISLPSFKGKLPRPRAVRKQRKPLDNLLLPLIDESVRRQYLRREALEKGNLSIANELQEKRSKRQQAKELAEAARRDGNKMLSELWENEADMYGQMRADVTQDEGSYGAFLDKDEWYERDRVARATKLKKSKFGNLFDGL